MKCCNKWLDPQSDLHTARTLMFSATLGVQDRNKDPVSLCSQAIYSSLQQGAIHQSPISVVCQDTHRPFKLLGKDAWIDSSLKYILSTVQNN